MRASNHSDEVQTRYLGELAPLLKAAQPLETLSPVQQHKLRRRIVRTLFGMHRVRLRRRLWPVLAAVALLVIGGAAFATAQRLGFLPRLGSRPAADGGAAPSPGDARRRKVVRSNLASVGAVVVTALPAAEPQQTAVVVPEGSDSSVRLPGQGSLHVEPAGPSQASAGAGLLPMASPAARVGRDPARRSAAANVALDPARAPAPVFAAPRALAFASEPTPRLAVGPSSGGSPAAVEPGAPAPSFPAAAGPGSPTARAEAFLPRLAALPTPSEGPKPQLGDQALFGQALRMLRVAHDPQVALSSLREHARDYPQSPFASERRALEVEALLALHRDREALALLDAMTLDELPRSGERFVVRGELRAAARRWPEAAADFDSALARVSGSPAWHERALWGRGAARLRTGDREGGMADIERYRDTYPKGRFAAEAAKLSPKK